MRDESEYMKIYIFEQPCSQGFSLRCWEGRVKTLASAGHVTTRHPKILGKSWVNRSKMAETRGGIICAQSAWNSAKPLSEEIS